MTEFGVEQQADGLRAFEAVRNHDFSETTCFLCGADCGSTREHVFPAWLQSHFGLWDIPIVLLNGTTIPYRNLVIPCCRVCNNDHLGKIEREVQKNFTSGPEAIASMSRETLLVWVLKIFYGLLYREVFLVLERSDATKGTIISAEQMEQFQMLHYILQSCRIPMEFRHIQGDIPASLFVFHVQQPAEVSARFDFRDDVIHQTIYLRMGTVGILAAFDGGAQNVEGASFFPQHQNRPLHPVQFEELGAKLFLKARHLLRNPKIMFVETPRGIQLSVLSIAGANFEPVFSDWSTDESAEMLMHFLGYPRSVVQPDGGLVATWLTNDDSSLRFIPLSY